MKQQPWPPANKLVAREAQRKLDAIAADRLRRVKKLTDTSAPDRFLHIRQNAKREANRAYETKLLNEHNATLSKTLRQIDERSMKDEFINKSIEPRSKRTTNYGARVAMAREIHQRNWALLNQLRRVEPAIYHEEPFFSSKDKRQVLAEMRKKLQSAPAVFQPPESPNSSSGSGSRSGQGTFLPRVDSRSNVKNSSGRKSPFATSDFDVAQFLPRSPKHAASGSQWDSEPSNQPSPAGQNRDNNNNHTFEADTRGTSEGDGADSEDGPLAGFYDHEDARPAISPNPSTAKKIRRSKGQKLKPGARGRARKKVQQKELASTSLLSTPRSHGSAGHSSASSSATRTTTLPGIVPAEGTDCSTVFFSHDCLVPFVSSDEDDSEYREMGWDIAVIDIANSRRPSRGLLVRGSRRDPESALRRMTTEVLIDIETLRRMILGQEYEAPPDDDAGRRSCRKARRNGRKTGRSKAKKAHSVNSGASQSSGAPSPLSANGVSDDLREAMRLYRPEDLRTNRMYVQLSLLLRIRDL